MLVSCLRWRSNGLYACALEPNAPFSLGFAAEPTQGFVPLWHRANTCRESLHTAIAPRDEMSSSRGRRSRRSIGADTAALRRQRVDAGCRHRRWVRRRRTEARRRRRYGRRCVARDAGADRGGTRAVRKWLRGDVLRRQHALVAGTRADARRLDTQIAQARASAAQRTLHVTGS